MTTTNASDASTAKVTPVDLDPQAVRLPGWTRACLAVLGLLFVILHWPYIERMIRVATDSRGTDYLEVIRDALTTSWNKDWSHALAIPFIAWWYVRQNRRPLLESPSRVYWPGLALMLAGIFSFMVMVYPVNQPMFQAFSMMAALAGMALFLFGPTAMRVLWFPIAYLFFAVKLPDYVTDVIAWTLQDIAAGVSTVLLTVIGAVIGFEVHKVGNTIEILYSSNGSMVTSRMGVEEACSGLRMLMAFGALGVAMAFFSRRELWKKLVIVALTVPIAVVVNVGRVTILGLLSLINPEFARGDLHIFMGLIIMLPSAAALLMLVGWVLDRLFLKPAQPQADDERAAELDAPIRPHASWLRDGEATADGSSALRRVAHGAIRGAAVMFFAMAVAVLALAYLDPSLMGALLPGDWDWYTPGMSLVAAPIVAVLCGTALWLTYRHRDDVAKDQTSRPIGRNYAMGVAGGALLMAVLGFNSVVAAAKVVHFKLEVPLRSKLYNLPINHRGWDIVGKDQILEPAILEVLGTHDYISRHYARRGDPARGIEPALVRLHIAYYSGTPDGVPHVPARCFAANGASGEVDTITMQVAGPQYFEDEGHWWAEAQSIRMPVRVPAVSFSATRFTYTPPGAATAIGDRDKPTQLNVFYFFAANGNFLSSPYQVRLQGFDPTELYAYHCKIEVGVEGVSDPVESQRIATEFLSDMLPEILACLPDWVDVTEGRWPEKASTKNTELNGDNSVHGTTSANER